MSAQKIVSRSINNLYSDIKKEPLNTDLSSLDDGQVDSINTKVSNYKDRVPNFDSKPITVFRTGGYNSEVGGNETSQI